MAIMDSAVGQIRGNTTCLGKEIRTSISTNALYMAACVRDGRMEGKRYQK